MTFAFLRNTTAFTVALIGAALMGGAAPASGATITYSDSNCSSFSITGGNGSFTLVCNTQSGGGGSQPGVPSGCSITPSPGSLPVGGGSVSLSAACTSGDATDYQWTASPAVDGFPKSGASVTASIAATTAFTMVASNAQGNAQAKTTTIQVGGVAGGISCSAQGFTKTLSYNWNWANGGMTINTYNDPQGPIGQNGIIVVAFTPTLGALISALGDVSIAPYPAPLDSTTRTTTISTTPCTLGGSGIWSHTGSDQGVKFTVGAYNTRLYPPLVAGVQYYLNIASRNSTGASTCSGSGSTCDVRVQLSKPQ